MCQISNESRFPESLRSFEDFDGHEQVMVTKDESSGLHAIIAIHNTYRGPGVGGTRLWKYESELPALKDVLRLSKGMTYKNAISELPFGGGKAVILAPDFSQFSRGDLMRAFGRMVAQLEGAYYTAEDVGTSCADMDHVRRETDYIFGLADTSGDPSPHTARGVFLGMEACLEQRLRTDNFDGVRVLVQGVGHVGYHLCRLLNAKGAKLLISDINSHALQRCQQEFGATIIASEKLYATEAEIYAPCALGATLNDRTLDQLKVSIVAGAANNQLANEKVADALQQLGILYAPDYVINAGGIVNIACEMGGGYNAKLAEEEVDKIGPRLVAIFQEAKDQNQSTLAVANEWARARFEDRGQKPQIRASLLPSQMSHPDSI